MPERLAPVAGPGRPVALTQLWIVGRLLLMPLAPSLRPFTAAVTTRALGPVAIAGLLASLGYGAVLGGIFAWLSEQRR